MNKQDLTLYPIRCLDVSYTIAKIPCNRCRYNSPIDIGFIGIRYIFPKIKRNICQTFKELKK